MRSTSVRIAGAVIGFSACVLLVGGSANAGGLHTKVKFRQLGPDAITGVVRSPSRSCERRRTVKLLFAPAAPARRAALTPVGKDRTNRKGKWKIKGAFAAGHYRAVVPKKKVKVRKKGKLEDDLVEVEEDDEGDAGSAGKRTGKFKTKQCTSTRGSTDDDLDGDGGANDGPGTKTVGPFPDPAEPGFPDCDPGFFIDVYIDADAIDPTHQILDNDPPCPEPYTINVQVFDAGVKPPGNDDPENRWATHKTYRVSISGGPGQPLPFRIKVDWTTPD